jgi:hypothetical protein
MQEIDKNVENQDLILQNLTEEVGGLNTENQNLAEKKRILEQLLMRQFKQKGTLS